MLVLDDSISSSSTACWIGVAWALPHMSIMYMYMYVKQMHALMLYMLLYVVTCIYRLQLCIINMCII